MSYYAMNYCMSIVSQEAQGDMSERVFGNTFWGRIFECLMLQILISNNGTR